MVTHKLSEQRVQSAGNSAELIELLNARRIELRMKMLEVDLDAGLQSGYFAKLVCGARGLGQKSLDRLLPALGIKIALMPSSLPAERQREKILMFRHAAHLKEIASKGGRISRSRYTNAEWSKHCRRAARARWAKAGKAKPVRKHRKCAG